MLYKRSNRISTRTPNSTITISVITPNTCICSLLTKCVNECVKGDGSF